MLTAVLRHLPNKIAGAILGFTLLLGIGICSSTTGHAQYRNNDQDRSGQNDGYGNYGGSYELRQTALNAGYNEGNKQGRKDRNSRNSYGFQSQSAYQKATKDYNSRLGDRAVYHHYFRAAYENGFSDGVNGY